MGFGKHQKDRREGWWGGGCRRGCRRLSTFGQGTSSRQDAMDPYNQPYWNNTQFIGIYNKIHIERRCKHMDSKGWQIKILVSIIPIDIHIKVEQIKSRTNNITEMQPNQVPNTTCIYCFLLSSSSMFSLYFILSYQLSQKNASRARYTRGRTWTYYLMAKMNVDALLLPYKLLVNFTTW